MKTANDKTEKSRNGSCLCAPIGGNGDGPGPGGGLCSGRKRHRESRQAGRQAGNRGRQTSQAGRQMCKGGGVLKRNRGSKLTSYANVSSSAGELVGYRARASAVRRLIRRSASRCRQICPVGHDAHVTRRLSELLLGCTVSFELGQALGIDRCIDAPQSTRARIRQCRLLQRGRSAELRLYCSTGAGRILRIMLLPLPDIG
jgi:hypothetical protein